MGNIHRSDNHLCIISFSFTAYYTRLLLHLYLLPLASSMSSTTTKDGIQDLLKGNGFPVGLFPRNVVKGYSLDRDSRLQVFMEAPCVVTFESRVFYNRVVSANLSYGRLIGVEGLYQEELFICFPIIAISVSDQYPGVIQFDIGVAHRLMPSNLFREPPICEPLGGVLKMKKNDAVGKEKTFRVHHQQLM